MSRATLSIVVFGLYLIGLGVILVILPNPAIGQCVPTKPSWTSHEARLCSY